MLKRNRRFATTPPAKLARPLMRGNASPHARRAQLPQRVQHAAPDHRARTVVARLTANGRAQRTPTEARGARRAQRRPKARSEPLTGDIKARMFGPLGSRPNVMCGSNAPRGNGTLRPGLSPGFGQMTYGALLESPFESQLWFAIRRTKGPVRWGRFHLIHCWNGSGRGAGSNTTASAPARRTPAG